MSGGILNAGVNGVIINAGVNDKVVLRNLVIQGTVGTSSGLNGIRFLAGGNCISTAWSSRAKRASASTSTRPPLASCT